MCVSDIERIELRYAVLIHRIFLGLEFPHVLWFHRSGRRTASTTSTWRRATRRMVRRAVTSDVRMPWVQNPEHVVSQALGRFVVVVVVFPRCAAGIALNCFKL